MKRKEKSVVTYTEEDIQVFEGTEAIRKRPGMYIGGVDENALHHLFTEVINNSIDEYLAKAANLIDVILDEDFRGISVRDNGRGIPFKPNPKFGGRSTLEAIFTTTHSGGKFDSEAYKFSGGLHGVGVTVTNALTSTTRVRVVRENMVATIEFSRGRIVVPFKTQNTIEDDSSTWIYFRPDPEIFGDGCQFNEERILRDLEFFACLNEGLTITFRRGNNSITFNYEKGLERLLSKELSLEASELALERPLTLTIKEPSLELSFALNYTHNQKTNILSFVNNIHTNEGGTHVMGFRQALLNEINNKYSKGKKQSSIEKFSMEEVMDGLTAVISVKVINPMFENQTKNKLVTPEVRKLIYQALTVPFQKLFSRENVLYEQMIQRAIFANKVLKSLKNARDIIRKTTMGKRLNLLLPGKLNDCLSKNREDTELFLVEGDSAAGNAKMGRDVNTQAILALRGKVLNVYDETIDQIVKNKEVMDILTAIGLPPNMEKSDLVKARYRSIIIMTDADSDGLHIRCLLLTLFYKICRELIIEGRILIAYPPLYKVTIGKRKIYLYSENELDEYTHKGTIQRYKGLGVMNFDELSETTMHVDTRVTRVVNINEARLADRIVRDMMGSESNKRRSLIEGSYIPVVEYE